MAHKEWCGEPCTDCTAHCKLSKSMDQYEKDFSLLMELTAQILSNASAYQLDMLSRTAQEIYDHADAISSIEKMRLFFSSIDWDEMIASGNANLFLRFIATGDNFMEHFLAWGTNRGGINSTTIVAIEDEIYDFLIESYVIERRD